MSPQPWPRHPYTVAGAWQAIEDLRDRIDAMQIADEVEAGVSRAIQSHRIFGLTLAQKAAGAAAGLVVMVAAIAEILQAFGVL